MNGTYDHYVMVVSTLPVTLIVNESDDDVLGIVAYLVIVTYDHIVMVYAPDLYNGLFQWHGEHFGYGYVTYDDSRLSPVSTYLSGSLMMIYSCLSHGSLMMMICSCYHHDGLRVYCCSGDNVMRLVNEYGFVSNVWILFVDGGGGGCLSEMMILIVILNMYFGFYVAYDY